MTTHIAVPAVQVITFALGCMVLRLTRRHAAKLTPVLIGVAIVVAVLVLLAASLAYAPDDPDAIDAMAIDQAL